MRFANNLIHLLARDVLFDKTQYAADVVAFLNAIGVALLALVVVDETGLGAWARRRGRPILAVACLVYLGWCAHRVACYVRATGIYDHVEASTIAVSWLWAGHGAPLYHAPDAASRYSNLYGPALFLVDGLFLRAFGPSVFAAKLAGAALWAAGVALLYLALRREGPPLLALAATTYVELCLMLSRGEVSCFCLRADPHLVFWSCAGLFASGLRSRGLAALGCGVGAGVAVNLKLHGVLYMLPVFALLGQRHGARAVAGAAAIAALAAASPFVAAPRVSLPLYLGRLAGAARDGLEFETFKEALAEGAFVALPAAAALLRLALDDRRAWRDFLGSNRFLLAAFGAAAALTFILASKEGAGSHHLMPLYPSLAIILCRAWSQLASPDAERSWIGRLVKAASLAFVPMALSTTIATQQKQMGWERGAEAEAWEVLAEVEAVRGMFPGEGLAIGYGGNETYTRGNLRCLPVLQGQPYLLDSVALMDFQQEGHEISAATREAIRGGTIPVWLIPAGDEPFTAQLLQAEVAPIRPGIPQHVPAALFAPAPDQALRRVGVWRRAGQGRSTTSSGISSRRAERR